MERDTVGRRRNTDKFVSYTNANKEGAGIDVNRARFRFILLSKKNDCHNKRGVIKAHLDRRLRD